MSRFDAHRRPTATALFTLALAIAAGPVAAQVPPAKPAAQGTAVKPAPTQAPAAKPATGPAAAPVVDPRLEAARLAWDVRPLAERIEIQNGLVWTGDYTGALDGTFGRMTFEAIAAFQARHKFTPDGIPTAPALKALADVAKTKTDAVGFQIVADPATGVRMPLPTKLVGAAAKREGGSRWTSRDGRVLIDTWAFPGGDLAQIYERMKADQPGRKVVYSVLRADWFVVSDESGGRHGYARFVRGADGVRGFVLGHDATLGPDFDRVVIATAGRFDPFPGAATPGPAPIAAGPTTPPVAPPVAPIAVPAVAAAASGLMVAQGKVLTAATAVAGCRTLAVGGKPATVATADAGGIATLAVAGGAAGGLRVAATRDGMVTVVASGESGGRATTVATGGETAGGRVRAALQRGGHGAPVFDADGALIGFVANRPDESRAVAGLIPPARYELTDPAALSAALGAAGGTAEASTPGAPATTGRIAATWGSRVVAIVCGR